MNEIIAKLSHSVNRLIVKLFEATRERDMWRANHNNQVQIKRAVLDRPDLGDRAKLVMELYAIIERQKIEIGQLKEKLK